MNVSIWLHDSVFTFPFLFVSLSFFLSLCLSLSITAVSRMDLTQTPLLTLRLSSPVMSADLQAWMDPASLPCLYLLKWPTALAPPAPPSTATPSTSATGTRHATGQSALPTCCRPHTTPRWAHTLSPTSTATHMPSALTSDQWWMTWAELFQITAVARGILGYYENVAEKYWHWIWLVFFVFCFFNLLFIPILNYTWPKKKESVWMISVVFFKEAKICCLLMSLAQRTPG